MSPYQRLLLFLTILFAAGWLKSNIAVLSGACFILMLIIGYNFVVYDPPSRWRARK